MIFSEQANKEMASVLIKWEHDWKWFSHFFYLSIPFDENQCVQNSIFLKVNLSYKSVSQVITLSLSSKDNNLEVATVNYAPQGQFVSFFPDEYKVLAFELISDYISSDIENTLRHQLK